jgi:hypothetical protein
LENNQIGEKNVAENGGYLCPYPLSDGIVLDIGKKIHLNRFGESMHVLKA